MLALWMLDVPVDRRRLQRLRICDAPAVAGYRTLALVAAMGTGGDKGWGAVAVLTVAYVDALLKAARSRTETTEGERQ